MRRILFPILLIFILASCRPAAAPTPTAAVPTSTATAVPTETPAPSPTPRAEKAATPTPLPDGMESFIFPHYESLSASYSAAEWEADKGMGQGRLVHRKITGCEISDSSADALPEPLYSQPIGSLEFRTTRLQSGSNPPVTWFFPPADLSDRAPEDAGVVYFTVSAPLAVEADCLKAAERVLATLGPSAIP